MKKVQRCRHQRDQENRVGEDVYRQAEIYGWPGIDFNLIKNFYRRRTINYNAFILHLDFGNVSASRPSSAWKQNFNLYTYIALYP